LLGELALLKDAHRLSQLFESTKSDTVNVSILCPEMFLNFQHVWVVLADDLFKSAQIISITSYDFGQLPNPCIVFEAFKTHACIALQKICEDTAPLRKVSGQSRNAF
jgi:hypothetical protein